MIKAVIFDLDDTLYYEKDYVLGAFKDVCLYLSDKYNKEVKKLYKRCIEILEEHGRGKIFNILCEENYIEEDINNLVNIYRNSKPNLELYPDVIEFIKHIKNYNINTGIITDGCANVQWNKIKVLGLKNIIDKIIVTDDYGLGYSKPHIRSYMDIISFFNVKPCECIYVGDNPSKDFIGAKKIGIKTVRIIREKGDHINDIYNNKYEAELIVKNFDEIYEKLIVGDF